MTSIAITVEGVLRRVIGGGPIKDGTDLYYGLATRASLVLLTESFEEDPVLAHWLKMQGMREHQRVIYNSHMYGQEISNADIRRVCQVNDARRHGHDVTLVIEPDPQVSAALIENGYSVLTFTHAEYSVPAWRPDYKLKPTPWDMLVQRVEKEAELRANDVRREEE